MTPEICTHCGQAIGTQQEVERLNQWVNDLHSGMYINCVYCGHRYGPDPGTPVAMADVLKAHIEKCPKHPLGKAMQEIASLRTQLAEKESELDRFKLSSKNFRAVLEGAGFRTLDKISVDTRDCTQIGKAASIAIEKIKSERDGLKVKLAEKEAALLKMMGQKNYYKERACCDPESSKQFKAAGEAVIMLFIILILTLIGWLLT